MFHLFRAAINPSLGLQRCVENWTVISKDLRERNRSRTMQTEELDEKFFN
jgi:hypothetical protein